MIHFVFACLAAANLFRNADFSQSDGFDAPAGWGAFNWSGSQVSAKYVGDGVGEFKSANANCGYYRQYPVAMQPGGKYRFSAEVKASAKDGAKFGLICWPSPWSRDCRMSFPEDTKGAWQKVEQVLTIPATRGSAEEYSIGFFGSGTTNNESASVFVRNLRCEPVSAAEAAVSHGISDEQMVPLHARIVPIDPILGQVPKTNAVITCYWPAEPDVGLTNCTLSGLLYHNGVAGKRAKAKFGADGRAKLVFGLIGPCVYRLELKVNGPDGALLATNDYRMVGRNPPPKGPTGRRLNNFVTELVNAPLADGEVKFFRPTDGWVWISFDEASPTTRGYLDDCAVAAVHPYENERLIEAMRQVEAGWHTLRVRGAKGGRLRIHALKRVMSPGYALKAGPCDFTGRSYIYTFPFVKRYLLHAMNTVNNLHGYIINPKIGRGAVEFYQGRGLKVVGGAGVSFNFPDRNDPEKLYKGICRPNWLNGWDVNYDENKISCGRREHIVMSETLWRIIDERPKQQIAMYWGDATSFWFDDPKVHAAELSAIVNSGEGRGVSMPEVYAPALSTPEATDWWVDLFAKQVASLGEILPGAKDRTVFHLSPYIYMGCWTDEPCPETDIKAHYDRLLHIFATDPRFAENAGLGTGAAAACEEEMRRWDARCMRYYAIEGGTEPLAPKYGFKWNPGFVANPDFALGLTNWVARPAAGGAIDSVTIAKYGSKIQHRMKAPRGTGDSLAQFTASANGANRLEQRLTGLEVGRFYSLKFCTAERGNAEQRAETPPPSAFSATLEGAEEVDGLTYRRLVGSGVGERKDKLSTFITMHRYVFKARSAEAKLVFADRSASGESTPPGTRQLLNYVVFRPYYCETPEEPYEIARLLRGEDVVQ